MANDVLNSLLREYEQKKINAELDLEERKNKIYDVIPRLKEIDDELNSLGIQVAKSILMSPEEKSVFLNSMNEKMDKLKEEKLYILLKNNYPADFFKPNYECKICNDTGFILDSNYKTTMCNCLKQRLLDISFNKSNMSNLNKENFNNFNELIFSDEVDLAKYRFNISPRKNISNIKNKCIEFVDNFENPDYKNLLFVGSTGLR